MIRKTLKTKKMKTGDSVVVQKKVKRVAKNAIAIIFILLIIEIIMLQIPVIR